MMGYLLAAITNLTISGLTPYSSLTGNELIPSALSNTNGSITTTQIATLKDTLYPLDMALPPNLS